MIRDVGKAIADVTLEERLNRALSWYGTNGIYLDHSSIMCTPDEWGLYLSLPDGREILRSVDPQQTTLAHVYAMAAEATRLSTTDIRILDREGDRLNVHGGSTLAHTDQVGPGDTLQVILAQEGGAHSTSRAASPSLNSEWAQAPAPAPAPAPALASSQEVCADGQPLRDAMRRYSCARVPPPMDLPPRPCIFCPSSSLFFTTHTPLSLSVAQSTCMLPSQPTASASTHSTGFLSLPIDIWKLFFTDPTNVVALSFVHLDEDEWPFEKTNYIPHALLKANSKLLALIRSDTNDLTFPNVGGPCQRATIVITDDHRNEETRVRVTTDLGTAQGPAGRCSWPPAAPVGAKSYQATAPFPGDPMSEDEWASPVQWSSAEPWNEGALLESTYVVNEVHRLVNDLRCRSKTLDRDFPPLDRMKITHHLHIVWVSQE